MGLCGRRAGVDWRLCSICVMPNVRGEMRDCSLRVGAAEEAEES